MLALAAKKMKKKKAIKIVNLGSLFMQYQRKKNLHSVEPNTTTGLIEMLFIFPINQTT